MKNCLITGATRGLGLSLAQASGQRGYRVLGLARNQELLEQLREKNILQEIYVCDLASPRSIRDFLEDFHRKHDSLDLLIHNAAVQWNHSILDTDVEYAEGIREEFQINFQAPMTITASLLPALQRVASRVVVVTSLLQFAVKPAAPGYCSSKAALANWSKSLRAQLRETGVGVTEVIPGLIKTTMTEKASRKGVEPELLAEQILNSLQRDLVICRGARAGYLLNRLWPSILQHLLSRS